LIGIGAAVTCRPLPHHRAYRSLSIVHVVRASLHYVPGKMRKPVAADLQAIYRAATAADA